VLQLILSVRQIVIVRLDLLPRKGSKEYYYQDYIIVRSTPIVTESELKWRFSTCPTSN
jgi:hypothetical protein